MDIKEHSPDSTEFPPGYRFCPTDEEIISHYLAEKVFSKASDHIPSNKIIEEFNLYGSSPQELQDGKNGIVMYFFAQLERKYSKGERPNRIVRNGYWKVSGSVITIKDIANKNIIGYRRTLVYYEGKVKQGKKTNWFMHEYRVAQSCTSNATEANSKKMEWVLCKVYQKEKRNDEQKLENAKPEDHISNHGQVSESHESSNGGVYYQNMEDLLQGVVPNNHLYVIGVPHQNHLDLHHEVHDQTLNGDDHFYNAEIYHQNNMEYLQAVVPNNTLDVIGAPHQNQLNLHQVYDQVLNGDDHFYNAEIYHQKNMEYLQALVPNNTFDVIGVPHQNQLNLHQEYDQNLNGDDHFYNAEMYHQNNMEYLQAVVRNNNLNVINVPHENQQELHQVPGQIPNTHHHYHDAGMYNENMEYFQPILNNNNLNVIGAPHRNQINLQVPYQIPNVRVYQNQMMPQVSYDDHNFNAYVTDQNQLDPPIVPNDHNPELQGPHS